MTHPGTTPARSGLPGLPLERRRTHLSRGHSAQVLSAGVVSVVATARAVDRALTQTLQPLALPALRVMLGLLFVWFGGLKVTGRSPVAELVGLTLPFADPHLLMLVLGGAELGLGVLLMFGRYVRVALPVLGLHLVGTFATFFVVPSLMFRENDLLLLTTTGEFVVKNVVLIAATLVLIAHTSQTATLRHRET